MKSSQIPYMKTLNACLDTMVKKGYNKSFKAVGGKFKALETDSNYAPEQIHIVNFYRFEGISNPDDNAILYVIEADDGNKGTLIDAYGAYADPAVATLIVKVNDIHKEGNC